MKRIVLSLFLAAGCSGGFASVAVGQSAPDFAKYMQSPQALSAIASAVASAGWCSVPLQFDETSEGSQLVLGVHCRGDGDEEFSVFVTFMDDGDIMVPLTFDYAG